jgi:hypothetical protein
MCVIDSVTIVLIVTYRAVSPRAVAFFSEVVFKRLPLTVFRAVDNSVSATAGIILVAIGTTWAIDKNTLSSSNAVVVTTLPVVVST